MTTTIACLRCGGSGFAGYGTGYGDVCGECVGGQVPIPDGYQLHIHVVPSERTDGEWVARVLELDVVTEGKSMDHAADLAADAAKLVIREDIAAGRNPMARCRDTTLVKLFVVMRPTTEQVSQLPFLGEPS